MKENVEDLKVRYSVEGIKQQLIEMIINKYGNNHSIKTIIFKVNSYYDDERTTYKPLLILIDNNFEEVKHNINAYDFAPNFSEQSMYYNKTEEQLYIKDLTFTL